MSATSGDDAVARLDELLSEYTDEIHALMYEVMGMVDARLPGATRTIYANWNATVVGYSPDGKSRHAVCSIAAYPRWVNLFFAVGPDLPDPHRLLKGTGSTIRSVRIAASSDLDERVQALLNAAIDMGAGSTTRSNRRRLSSFRSPTNVARVARRDGRPASSVGCPPCVDSWF